MFSFISEVSSLLRRISDLIWKVSYLFKTVQFDVKFVYWNHMLWGHAGHSLCHYTNENGYQLWVKERESRYCRLFLLECLGRCIAECTKYIQCYASFRRESLRLLIPKAVDAVVWKWSFVCARGTCALEPFISLQWLSAGSLMLHNISCAEREVLVQRASPD